MFLGKTHYSNNAPLHPTREYEGYRGVGGDEGVGREFAIDRLSFYLGEVAILLVALYYRNCDKLRLNEALGSNVDLTLLFFFFAEFGSHFKSKSKTAATSSVSRHTPNQPQVGNGCSE